MVEITNFQLQSKISVGMYIETLEASALTLVKNLAAMNAITQLEIPFKMPIEESSTYSTFIIMISEIMEICQKTYGLIEVNHVTNLFNTFVSFVQTSVMQYRCPRNGLKVFVFRESSKNALQQVVEIAEEHFLLNCPFGEVLPYYQSTAKNLSRLLSFLRSMIHQPADNTFIEYQFKLEYPKIQFDNQDMPNELRQKLTEIMLGLNSNAPFGDQRELSNLFRLLKSLLLAYVNILQNYSQLDILNQDFIDLFNRVSSLYSKMNISSTETDDSVKTIRYSYPSNEFLQLVPSLEWFFKKMETLVQIKDSDEHIKSLFYFAMSNIVRIVTYCQTEVKQETNLHYEIEEYRLRKEIHRLKRSKSMEGIDQIDSVNSNQLQSEKQTYEIYSEIKDSPSGSQLIGHQLTSSDHLENEHESKFKRTASRLVGHFKPFAGLNMGSPIRVTKIILIEMMDCGECLNDQNFARFVLRNKSELF